MGRQRKAAGVGFIARATGLNDDERGIAVSTLGKVIMRGWDWIGLSPSEAETVTGLVEIPPLAKVLTPNKADFIRTGKRGATYLAYRKAVQEAVSLQLEAWGSAADARPEPRRRTRTLERDLRSVLADLSEEYPLLATPRRATARWAATPSVGRRSVGARPHARLGPRSPDSSRGGARLRTGSQWGRRAVRRRGRL